MPLTPPSTPPLAPQRNGLPTQVWFVQGKAANKAFRTALSLHRENATLSENKENIPPDVKEADPQRDLNKEKG